MRLRGINYDVGTQTGPYLSRTRFDAGQTRDELGTIKKSLHCNAVRISGTDPERLVTATELALGEGLQVWLSPQLHDGTPDETLAYTTACAEAARQLNSPDLVYLLGCELTLFMRGILPGDNLFDRLKPHRMLWMKYARPHNKPLNAFLAKAVKSVRAVFDGPVGYASAPIEAVDWTDFDFVCLDYYRARRNRDDYGERLQRHLRHGKPVVITEFGCCAYRGAQDRGAMAWTIVDPKDHDRLTGEFVRDEELQAAEVLDMLRVLEASKLDGAFVFTFSAPALPHRPDDPRRDLDLASYAVVRSYDDGHWEPKRVFHALADYYAQFIG